MPIAILDKVSARVDKALAPLLLHVERLDHDAVFDESDRFVLLALDVFVVAAPPRLLVVAVRVAIV